MKYIHIVGLAILLIFNFLAHGMKQAVTHQSPTLLNNKQLTAGENDLIHAVKNRNVSRVKYLVNNKVNSNICDANGTTLLELAAYFNYSHSPSIVKILIDNGSTQKDKALLLIVNHSRLVNDENTYARETHLNNCSLQLVQLLIAAGANVNVRDDTASTPLMLATKHNHTEIATALIEADADLDAINNFGETAFVNAWRQENFELVYLLVKANVNIPSEYYLKTLKLAESNDHIHRYCKNDVAFYMMQPRRKLFVRKKIETILMMYNHSTLSILSKDIFKKILTYTYPEYAMDGDALARLHPQFLIEMVPLKILATLIKSKILNQKALINAWVTYFANINVELDFKASYALYIAREYGFDILLGL